MLGTCLALVPLAAQAAEQCPDMLAAQRNASEASNKAARAAPRPTDKTPSDAPVELEADDAQVSAEGLTHLKGNVTVKQGDRQIRAEDVEYRDQDNGLKVEGDVEFDDPVMHATGGGGTYSATRGATFRDAEFELKERSARGKAANMQMTPEGLIKLNEVSFTTCPRNDASWQLRAKEIDLDTRTRIGTGHGTRVDFKGVPILYLPWMSFPLGTERKSGFLFPTIGNSTRGGLQLAVPYYWNIAPNADLTFEPMFYSKRGLDLTGETRLLTEYQKTSLEFSYLPNDSVTNSDRNRLRLENISRLPNDVRFFIDAETVSDSHYFEDFAQGPEGTSVSFVQRLAGFRYRDEHWNASAEFQQFQTINRDLLETDRPYARLPRILLGADYGWGPEERLRYGFDSELVNFDRNVGVTGWRLDAMPSASLDFGGPGLWVRPGVAWRYTDYSLDYNTGATDDKRTLTRSLPIASFDAGMIFEKESGSRGQRRLTLEPRVLYLNTPFRRQDDIPLFDTGVPDLNLVQLFRTNRYVGADRVSDANQVSAGVTSRLYDAQNGAQFLEMTLGQTYYFKQPRVHLPDELDRDSNTSDFVGQIAVTAYKHWNADFGIQWNPDQSRSERAQANVQFKPAGEQVINVGYRFQRGSVEQVELSTAWPIGKTWNAFARYVYSLKDDASNRNEGALERFAGLEYQSCCWRMRVVGRKSVSTRTGEQDTGVYLQLELTGLASVGSAADAFLSSAIRGYERPVVRP